MLAELPAFPRPPTQLSLGLNQVGSAVGAAADEPESTPSPQLPTGSFQHQLFVLCFLELRYL